MRTPRQATFRALAATACALALGCAPAGAKYGQQRWNDFADCFTVTVGGGMLSYARVKFTDFIVAGFGIAARERWGWRGRYGDRGWEKQRGGDVYIGDMHYEAGLPLLGNEEGSDGDGNRVSTLGPGSTTRRYAKDLEPGRGGKIAEMFWIGVVFTAGASIELGINPVELIDFIIGFSPLDILGDDEWRPKPIAPPTPAPAPTAGAR